MKAFSLVAALILGVVATSVAQAESQKPAAKLAGVTGNLVRIEKNQHSVGPEDVTVHVGDRVEIDWTYPISPPFPKQVSADSDNAAVKFDEIQTIQRLHGPVGVGILGAFFTAASEGTANLTFAISSGGGQGVILKVKVTVQK